MSDGSLVTEGLARVCSERLLDEKWLIAPSRRVAHQWLDQVTRGGGPVVNVRVQTMRTVALELLRPALATGEMNLLAPAVRCLVVAEAWHRAIRADGYLGQVRLTPRLIALAGGTLGDLRMAGLGPDAVRVDHFEEAQKGRELKALLVEYQAELKRRKLIDYADAMRLAAAKLREQVPDVLLILPEDLGHSLTALERALLDGFGAGRVVQLPVDRPAEPHERTEAASDLAQLRWIDRPGDAPEPVHDGSVRVVHAIGEINEVRQAFRCCLTDELGLDQVEILSTAAATYVPLIYETALRVFDFDAALDLGVPVTFAEGVPARLSRPGRLLAAWLSWIHEGYPQATLLRMLQADLLKASVDDAGDPVGAARLARSLRSLGIGFGRERYVRCIRERLDALAEQDTAHAENEEKEPDPLAAERHERRVRTMRALDQLVRRLIEVSPPSGADAATVVAAATALVRDHARTSSGLDGLARQHLLQELESMGDALGGAETARFDAWEWLRELPDRLRVGGSGPRPGHLHVAAVQGGGHSGRPHTIILGLDDARLPSAGHQDPLLLDDERGRLEAGLATSQKRLREQLDDFAKLLCRLRGRVTLSFSSREIEEDSETFASPVLLSAFRMLSGRTDGDHGDLAKWLAPAASFAAVSPEACLDSGEWWLCRGSQAKPVAGLRALAETAFPNLKRGREAGSARESDDFTVFDGRIEAPGKELDPARPEGPVLSATGWLGKLGECPLRYFYHRVLGIRPPDDVEVDPQQWLNALQYGTLLHDVLYEFVGDLLEAGEWPPDPARDLPRIAAIASAAADGWRQKVPPPNVEAERRRRRDLERAVEIFINEQARRGDRSRPVYIETGVGMPTEGRPTDLDAPGPVRVDLPGGSSIRARARIDRIDRLRESSSGGDPAFLIVDYKSGSYTKSYDPSDIFDQGRLVQHVLYMAVAESVLREHFGPDATVDEFIFFFPAARAHGRAIDFGRHIVPEGLEVIEKLCALPATGAFPATDNVGDCMFCDYRRACQGVDRHLEVVCESTKRKLANDDNTVLRPFVELRCAR